MQIKYTLHPFRYENVNCRKNCYTVRAENEQLLYLVHVTRVVKTLHLLAVKFPYFRQICKRQRVLLTSLAFLPPRVELSTTLRDGIGFWCDLTSSRNVILQPEYKDNKLAEGVAGGSAWEHDAAIICPSPATSSAINIITPACISQSVDYVSAPPRRSDRTLPPSLSLFCLLRGPRLISRSLSRARGIFFHAVAASNGIVN